MQTIETVIESLHKIFFPRNETEIYCINKKFTPVPNMSTLRVLTLSNAEKPHQHLAFNIESPYGSYLLDRFQMTSPWPMTKNRRP